MENEQVKEIIKYFKNSEKREEDFKIGVEFEHFIINKKTLEAISYYEKGGIEDTLKELLNKGWNGHFEGEYLLGLNKNGANITLEPGGQLEISIEPNEKIKNIESRYIEFLEEIIPILENKDQFLICIGYQPESKIQDIPFIPKERYKYMSEYFTKRGKYAHNMMKGTASMQVAIDYKSEKDYIKKFKLANFLSPILSLMFDNTPFFEGKKSSNHCVRVDIWENCDSDRCSIVKNTLNSDFGYKTYANYILNFPPIFIDYGNEVKYTDDKKYKELFDNENYTIKELEHVFTMAFPDVRTKNFIEIRMVDSIPYPLNLSFIALIKGLFYNEENLNLLYNQCIEFNDKDIKTNKKEIIKSGIDSFVYGLDVFTFERKLIDLAKKSLNEEEKKYLLPLESMFKKRKTPSLITKDKLNLGKSKAINWCVLNNKLKGECDCKEV